MEIRRKVQAGTMQSSDVMVFIEPAEDMIIEIDSTVKKQFEHLIRQKVQEVLDQFGITAGRVRISDRGALDYAIAGRMEAAVKRALERP